MDTFHQIDFETLKHLLDEDRLNVKDEVQIWETIQLWILKDSKKRKLKLKSLLSTIRYGRLSWEYLEQKLIKSSIMDDFKEEAYRIMETYKSLEVSSK